MTFPAASPPQVLLVESDLSARRHLAALVPKALGPGTVVTAVGTLDAARPLVIRTAYHLVLAAQGGASLSGLDLLAAAYRRCPSTVRILLIGPDDPGVSVAALTRARVDALVRRPWDETRLVAGLRHLVMDRASAEPRAPSRSEARAPSLRRVSSAPPTGAAWGSGRVAPPTDHPNGLD